MNFDLDETTSVSGISIEGLRECDEDDMIYAEMLSSDSAIDQAGVGGRVFMGLAALALAASNAFLAACGIVTVEDEDAEDAGALASPEYGGHEYFSSGDDASFSISFNDVPSGDRVKVYTDAACTQKVGKATSSGGYSTDVEIPSLAAGTHSFYAKAYRGEAASACSLALENYEIEQDVGNVGSEVSDDVALEDNATLEEEAGPADASDLGAGDVHTGDHVHDENDQDGEEEAAVAAEAATPAL